MPKPLTQNFTTNDLTDQQDYASLSFARRQYPVDWFDRKNGLGSSQVHQTVTSSDGRLWAATPSGLISYDGVRFTQFGINQGLNCHGLRALAIDSDDRLWVGSDAGVQRLNLIQTGIESHSWDSIGVIESIAVGAEAALIGTTNGLYCHREDTGYVKISEPRLARANIADVHIAESGQMIVLGPDIGLAIGDTAAWAFIELLALSRIGPLRECAKGADDQLIIVGDRGMVICTDTGKLVCGPYLSNRISAPCWDDGRVIASIDGTIVSLRIDDGNLLPTEQLVGKCHANHLQRDDFGNIWASTENDGLCRISCLRHSISYPDMSEIGAILCIKPSSNGIMMGGTNGLRLSDRRIALGGTKAWDVLQDDVGMIWVASERGLQCIVNAGLPIAYHHDNLVLAAPCRALLQHNNELLIGSIRGLARVTSQGAHEILTPEGNPLGYVYSLFVDAKGLVWVATLGAGLWQYDGVTLTQANNGSLAEARNVYALTQLENGEIFVAHDNCISKIEIDMLPHLFSCTNEAIAAWALGAGPDNRLLVGSTRGLLEFASETGALLRRIEETSGPGNWEFTTSRALMVRNDGTILCGLASGLAEIKMGPLGALSKTPEAQISEVRWIGVAPVNGRSGVSVAEGKWRVEFDLRTTWFVDEAACEMRFRLLGFDSKWSKFSAVSTIAYSSLPAGIYTLDVEMRSPIAGVGVTKSVYTFRVRAFWNSIGLRLLAKLPFDLGWSRMLHYIRSQRAMRRSRELEQMIRQRTEELLLINNDLTMARNELDFLAHSDALTGIANRRRFERALENGYVRAQDEGAQLALILIDIDHFKGYNDFYGHPAGDAVLSQVAQAIQAQLRKPSDLVARVGGEEFAILLPGGSPSAAVQVADRVKRCIEQLKISHAAPGAGGVLTVSMGVANFDESADAPASLFSCADRRLYSAKASGRNCYVSADLD